MINKKRSFSKPFACLEHIIANYFHSGAQQTIERLNYLCRESIKVWIDTKKWGDDRLTGQRSVEFIFKIVARNPDFC